MLDFVWKCIEKVRTTVEHIVSKIKAFFHPIKLVPASTAPPQVPQRHSAVPSLTLNRPRTSTCPASSLLRPLQVLPIVPSSSKGFVSSEAKNKPPRRKFSWKTSVPISFPSVAERVREWEKKVTPSFRSSSHLSGTIHHQF
jgi:hypothetical protein